MWVCVYHAVSEKVKLSRRRRKCQGCKQEMLYEGAGDTLLLELACFQHKTFLFHVCKLSYQIRSIISHVARSSEHQEFGKATVTAPSPITHQPTIIVASGCAALHKPCQPNAASVRCSPLLLGDATQLKTFSFFPEGSAEKRARAKPSTVTVAWGPESDILSRSCQKREALVWKWQLGLPDEAFGCSLTQKQLEWHVPFYIPPARGLKV